MVVAVVAAVYHTVNCFVFRANGALAAAIAAATTDAATAVQSAIYSLKNGHATPAGSLARQNVGLYV